MNSPRPSYPVEDVRRLFDELVNLPESSRRARLDEIRLTQPDLALEIESILAFAAEENLRGMDGRSSDGDESHPRELPPLVGQTVAHFRILERLGGGGMGVVYRAEDLRLHRTVALKFLPPDIGLKEEARQRLVVEARAVSRIDHPNICTVFDIGETEDGRTFIVMAHYEGRTLKQELAGGPLSAERAVAIARQILAGLKASHELGVVHRDLKPANIFLTNEGTVKLLDYGLARVAGVHLTRTGRIVGTAPYMAPEQVRGEEVDCGTDIWSFGVVLYEMLTGRKAFGDSYDLAILYSIVHSEPEPLSSTIPAPVRSVVAKCLRKDRKARYGSVAEVERDLSGRRGLPVPRIDARAAAAVAVVFVGLLVLWVLVSASGTAFQSVSSLFGQAASMPDQKSIAVLPFANVGDDPANEAFVDGLVETLTSKLSQLESHQQSLWVVPASEVRSRGIQSVEGARGAFGVNLVVTGSLLRMGTDVRLTLNLADAGTLRQLHSSFIDAELTDVTAFQDRVARALLEMLALETAPLFGRLREGDTVVPGAYDFYLQGRGALQRRDHLPDVETAIVLLTRAVDADPEFALGHAALGEAFWRKYQLTRDGESRERALLHAGRAVERGKNLAGVHVSLGMVQTGVGRYEEALGSFRTAIRLDNDHSDAYREMALAFEAMARLENSPEYYRQAEENLKHALRLRPDYWAAYNDLGVFYFKRGRYDEAVEQFKHSLTLAPRNAQTYNRLGATYFNLGHNIEAADYFERSIEIEPNYKTYLNLGTFYYFEKQRHLAAGAYEKALELNENDYRVWGWLGEAYYWSSRRDEAVSAFGKAIQRAEMEREINPKDVVLLGRLAAYYAYAGDAERAYRTIEQALALAPADAEVLAHAAEVYLITDDRVRAARYVRRALDAGFDPVYIDRSPLLGGLDLATLPVPE